MVDNGLKPLFSLRAVRPAAIERIDEIGDQRIQSGQFWLALSFNSVRISAIVFT